MKILKVLKSYLPSRIKPLFLGTLTHKQHMTTSVTIYTKEGLHAHSATARDSFLDMTNIRA